MGDEEKLKILIEAQYKAQKAFDEANEQIRKTEQNHTSMTDKMNANADKMKSVGSKMTKYMTLPIAAMGAVSFKAGAEMQDAMGAVDTIFKKSSDTVQKWANSLPSYYGIAKTEAMQYASTMGSMMKNIGGLTDEEAAKQSAKLIELAGDLSATFGGSTQDAVRALTGALKGNNTMLDNYGISALDAEVKAKAMRKGLIKADVNMAKVEQATIKVDEARKKSIEVTKKYGKESDEARKANNELALAQQGVEEAMAGSTSEMDAATKQAATLSLIMDQTKDVQGQAAREAKGGSGQIKAMQTDMKNLSAEIGTKLLPVGIKLLGWGSNLVGMFGKLSPGVQNVILVVAGLAAAMGPLLFVTGKLVTTTSKVVKQFTDAESGTRKLTGWIGKHGKSIAETVKFQAQYRAMQIKENALKAAAKVKTVALTVAEKARMMATKVATAAQAAFNAVMSANPVFLVVAAVVALVAIMVVLYKKNKTVRDFIDKSWKVISGTFMTVFNAIKGVVMGVFNWLKSNWQLILGIIMGPIGLIILAFTKYKDEIITVFKTIWEAIKVVWNGIVVVIKWAWENVIKPLWDLLYAYVTTILIPMWKKIWDVVKVVWNGIVTAVKWAWENVIKPTWDLIYAYVTTVLIPMWKKIWEAVQAVWNFIKPVFEAIWAYIRDTLIPVFQSIWDKVRDVFTNIWNKIVTVKDSIVSAFNTVKDAIGTLIEKFRTIKDKVSDAFDTVSDAIKAPFKAAFNWIAGAWNKTLGKLSFTIPSWVPEVGGKKFDMPDMPTLYKGMRNWPGGAAVVGDVRGQGGEIVNLPTGSDVFNNRESKRIMRAMADGTFSPNGNGGGTVNTFTGNIYLMNEAAVKEFFRQLDRQGELSAMGVAV